MIPPFSRAISARVDPRYCWWSSPILVMMDTRGVSTLVASSLPPKPTSTMAISTRAWAKMRKANTVIISNGVNRMPAGSRSGLIAATVSTTSPGETHRGPIRIRSQKSIRCGDVNKPALYPAALRMACNMAAVEPFPFVPAICTLGNWRCGSSPKRSASVVRSSLRSIRSTSSPYSHAKVSE